jgi:hypothetical protein
MWFLRHAGALVAAAALSTACAAAGPPSTSPRSDPATAGSPSVPAQRPADPVATAAIAGRVVSGTTRDPIARARVVVTSPVLTAARVALTDDRGAYAFTGLPAGAFVIRGSRTGFASQQLGSANEPLTVSAGARVHAPDLVLPEASVIAGRILDEDGTPLAGARIVALPPQPRGGHPSRAPTAEASSNDAGEFRLTGLASGEYVVAASDPAFSSVGDEHGALDYGPTYFPGVSLIEDARTVSAGRGADAPRIEFRLRIVRPAQVSGTLVAPGAGSLRSAAVILAPLEGPPETQPPRDIALRPDGQFVFRNVRPGHYYIRARGELEEKGVALFAAYRVVVDGSDVTGIEMRLEPGAQVAGSVQAAKTSTEDLILDTLSVRAPFADGTSFGDALTGRVDANGRFEIRGLMPGRHYVAVEGLLHPWFVAAVLLRGRDVVDGLIDISGGEQFPDARIILADNGAQITGAVTGADGQPSAHRLVVAGPALPELWEPANTRVRVTRSDASGAFELSSLPPGEYRVAAVRIADERDLYRAEVATHAIESGTAVTVGPRESRAVNLTVRSSGPPDRRR